MATDNKKSPPPVFFVTKSGFGFKEGVYTQEEIIKLPKGARKYIISLSVAEAMGLVVLDYSTGDSVYEMNAYAPGDPDKGTQTVLRGVNKGTLESHEETSKTSSKKIGNKLRDKIVKTQSSKKTSNVKSKK